MAINKNLAGFFSDWEVEVKILLNIFFNMINCFLDKAALNSVSAVIRHRLMVSFNSENQGDTLFWIIALDCNPIKKSGMRIPLLGI